MIVQNFVCFVLSTKRKIVSANHFFITLFTPFFSLYSVGVILYRLTKLRVKYDALEKPTVYITSAMVNRPL